MFWKKKKIANEQTISALFIQVATLSYDIHDKAIEADKDNHFLDGRHEELFRHILAASVMTAIAKLENPMYEVFYEKLMIKLNGKYEGTHELSLHFNNVLREKYEVDEGGNENLSELIAYWLYFSVGSNNELDFEKEFVPYVIAAQMVYRIYDNWFVKNDMPIK